MSDIRFLDRQTPPHLLTLTALAGLSALSTNVFLPSLPGMAQDFGAPYAVLQLSVALYLGLSAVLQVLIGPISDRFGRRLVLIGALALFLLASLGTVLARDAATFLACRMAQAVVAAGMVLSRAVIRDVTEGAEAAARIAHVTLGMSLVPMIGPVLGGFLDQAFGWRANFTLLFGLGLIVTALIWADLGETLPERPSSFSKQLRQYPALLGSGRFWGYALAAAFGSGAFFAYLGGGPFVGDQVFHLGASEVGIGFAVSAAGYSLGNALSGRFSTRVGLNRMVLWGTAVTAGGMGVLLLGTLVGLHDPVFFFGMMISVGLGNGLATPNANAGMLSIEPALAGTASGLGGAIMIGGGAALAALAGAMLGPQTGELPLVAIMFGSGLASVFAILWVIALDHRAGIER